MKSSQKQINVTKVASRLSIVKLLCFLPILLVTFCANGQTDPSSPGYDAAKQSLIGSFPQVPGLSLTTDSTDYHPGSTAIIKGGGFSPGETVTMQVKYADGTVVTDPQYDPWTVTADANGKFTTSWLVDADDLGHKFVATATGLTGNYSEIAFTDATIANSCFINPDATYTALAGNDDLSTGAIALPFTFQLYGTSYTTAYVNNNGNLTFAAADGTYSSSGFPSTIPMVAPFWADVETDLVGNTVKYKVFPHKFIATWAGVGYYRETTNPPLVDSFMVIITDGTDASIGIGNNVAFYYGKMNWTTGDASGGVSGFNGTSGISVYVVKLKWTYC